VKSKSEPVADGPHTIVMHSGHTSTVTTVVTDVEAVHSCQICHWHASMPLERIKLGSKDQINYQ
jgi:hypothetical protein